MKEFARLVKRKNAALTVFTKARDELKCLYEDLVREERESYERAADEHAKQHYLAEERKALAETIVNISAVVGE